MAVPEVVRRATPSPGSSGQACSATVDGTDAAAVDAAVDAAGSGTVCFPAGSPGHSWQNVAAVGSPIGHKGMMVAAKVLALSTVDLLQDADALREARADFQKRMKDRPYTTVIPKGQKAPKSIR